MSCLRASRVFGTSLGRGSESRGHRNFKEREMLQARVLETKREMSHRERAADAPNGAEVGKLQIPLLGQGGRPSSGRRHPILASYTWIGWF